MSDGSYVRCIIGCEHYKLNVDEEDRDAPFESAGIVRIAEDVLKTASETLALSAHDLPRLKVVGAEAFHQGNRPNTYGEFADQEGVLVIRASLQDSSVLGVLLSKLSEAEVLAMGAELTIKKGRENSSPTRVSAVRPASVPQQVQELQDKITKLEEQNSKLREDNSSLKQENEGLRASELYMRSNYLPPMHKIWRREVVSRIQKRLLAKFGAIEDDEAWEDYLTNKVGETKLKLWRKTIKGITIGTLAPVLSSGKGPGNRVAHHSFDDDVQGLMQECLQDMPAVWRDLYELLKVLESQPQANA
jgi:hypothetical protein